ncbi:hypothetical protein H310_04022 [Aphanomyces invadans]|uniref:Tetratricopeptide repeat protein 5 OB fold domain-containing protein n=1 Tax=Aphanomyces invadans TaxID=157072 RepID=A0A024UGF1_9STRA|nr:hypothetical protein H310_04022 [Aphanomyces invadans]ETW04922.1 hypothetical protein H310_04022 [Aphanomyces invadans]|eukprot:XP_008866360.1 hypothetical protein H310_04022 [Aphanomyces invadans]
MEVALAKLDELYSIHDHFFSANKEEKKLKLQALVDEVMALVDDVGMDRSNSRELKATAWYIQGKALEVFPEYNPSSEALLTKAAKLDPCNSDIWVSLGNCFWKKGDLEAAKNCFESCLDYGPSKHALRSLSMVLRKMGTNVEEKTSNIKASITHAKAALNLDIQDGESWYVMGNAYLALFFACSHSTVDLDRSLAAYARAEAGGAANNPDLHFNRANVHRYKEDYALAVQSFCKAHALDPSLRAMAIVDGILRWTLRVSNLIHHKGRFKVTRIAQLASALPPVCEVQGRTRVSISSLQQGHNEGKVVALKLLVDVVRGNEPPGCFVMMDEAQTCCAVSIYHLDSVAYTKMTERDVFYVLDPFVKVVHLEYNCMSINYVCLHVAEPHLFLINGHVVAESYAHAEIHLKNFDL